MQKNEIKIFLHLTLVFSPPCKGAKKLLTNGAKAVIIEEQIGNARVLELVDRHV